MCMIHSFKIPPCREANSVNPPARRHLIEGLIKINNNIKCLTIGGERLVMILQFY